MSEMTARQSEDWTAAVAEAQRYVDTSTIPADIGQWEWRVTWAEEVRPGRGQALDATWCDGAYLVQIRMDVYGYPIVCVAETNWLHNSSNEECDCSYCEDERDVDE